MYYIIVKIMMLIIIIIIDIRAKDFGEINGRVILAVKRFSTGRLNDG